MRMRKLGIVPIHGLDYKDKPDDAALWLDSMGSARQGARVVKSRRECPAWIRESPPSARGDRSRFLLVLRLGCRKDKIDRSMEMPKPRTTLLISMPNGRLKV
jgi:hypothetical protein